MKKLLLIYLLLPLVVRSQNTSPSTTHLKCVKFLLKNLNDPGSYQGVSWGTLKKDEYPAMKKSTALITVEGKIQDKENEKNNLLHYISSSEGLAKVTGKVFNDSLKQKTLLEIRALDIDLQSLNKDKQQIEVSDKSVSNYYYIEHTFRARNAYNALRLATYTFFLDKNLKVTGYNPQSVAEQAADEKTRRDEILDQIQKLKEGN